jgi:hypothetical protein
MNQERVRKEFNKYWWDRNWIEEEIESQYEYMIKFNPDASERDREIYLSAKGRYDQLRSQLIIIKSLL